MTRSSRMQAIPFHSELEFILHNQHKGAATQPTIDITADVEEDALKQDGFFDGPSNMEGVANDAVATNNVNNSAIGNNGGTLWDFATPRDTVILIFLFESQIWLLIILVWTMVWSSWLLTILLAASPMRTQECIV